MEDTLLIIIAFIIVLWAAVNISVINFGLPFSEPSIDSIDYCILRYTTLVLEDTLLIIITFIIVLVLAVGHIVVGSKYLCY